MNLYMAPIIISTEQYSCRFKIEKLKAANDKVSNEHGSVAHRAIND